MLKLSGGEMELNEQFFKGNRERERKEERMKKEESKILKQYFFTFNKSNFKWKTVRKVT